LATRGIMLRLALAVLLGAGIASPAAACPEPSPALMFHSCWGAASAEIRLMPEDGLPEPAGRDATRELVVSGGYTGADMRGEDRPNPVGLFMRRGEVINPTLAPMDGILIVAPEGDLRLQHRARAGFGGMFYDLRAPDQRNAFREAAATAGVSVLQSHLLVVDGTVDVRERDDAPRALRRVLFTDAHGYGIYQPPGLLTLHAAAEAVARDIAPIHALNLDMGSHDYCRLGLGGEPVRCGFRALDDLSGLSNLLSFRLR